MTLSAMLVLATSLASAEAFYWTNPRYETFWYSEPYYTRELDQPAESYTSSRWSVSSGAYELKVRMPDLEPASVKAALAQDGTKIEVIGERKIEGCTCQPSTLKEIALPYRPRPEDIDVAMEKDGVLTLRLERHAKADAPTPLTVKQAAVKEEPPEAMERSSSFRFVPHSSVAATNTAGSDKASASTKLAEQERSLTDKFRAAALASVAVQTSSTSSAGLGAKETANATSEATNAPPAASAAFA